MLGFAPISALPISAIVVVTPTPPVTGYVETLIVLRTFTDRKRI